MAYIFFLYIFNSEQKQLCIDCVFLGFFIIIQYKNIHEFYDCSGKHRIFCFNINFFYD